MYFVTFRSARGELNSECRNIVIKTVLYDNNDKYELFFGVVMPDHVHLLLKPLPDSDSGETGNWHDLSEILRRIKGVSARKINKATGMQGKLWQKESFDRIIRDEEEYSEKLQYMYNNPVAVGLVRNSREYEYFIIP